MGSLDNFQTPLFFRVPGQLIPLSPPLGGTAIHFYKDWISRIFLTVNVPYEVYSQQHILTKWRPREILCAQDHLASSPESCLVQNIKIITSTRPPTKNSAKKSFPFENLLIGIIRHFVDVKGRSLTWMGSDHSRTLSRSASAIFPLVNGSCQTLKSKKPGTIPANCILKPSWRLTCRSIYRSFQSATR